MAWLPKKDSIKSLKESLSKSMDGVVESVKSLDIDDAKQQIKSSVSSATEKTLSAATSTYQSGKDASVNYYRETSIKIIEHDYSEYKKIEFYRASFDRYRDLSSQKVVAYFKATLEVDKETLDVVQSVRGTLPVPAQTVEDIFDQCKGEALRRAIASFALQGTMSSIDNHSALKYENASESYGDFKARTGQAMFDDPNFAAMKDERYQAKQDWSLLENGYNKNDMLDPFSADIEHVISRKEYFGDLLIRLGTTDDEFFSLINSKENLVFADSSFNRAIKDGSAMAYIEAKGVPHAANPDLVDIKIQSTGETVTVSKSDINQAVELAEQNRWAHRLDAAAEIGSAAAKTGAVMAAQQVIGLVVLETIDIFVDEVKDATVKGDFINDESLLEKSKVATDRIRAKLVVRFEERDIWNRAKSVGAEAGVSGALSVIPQILVSLITKLPSFVLAIIRECTLSLVRCVRLMASAIENKLEAISVILAGAISAMIGIYIGKIISEALMPIPVLNNFAPQLTSVLSGILVFAVPLAAIYVFDQNKHKLNFVVDRKKNKPVEGEDGADSNSDPSAGMPPAPAV